MRSWNADLFFFILAAFAIYTMASGYGMQWKQVLSQPMT